MTNKKLSKKSESKKIKTNKAKSKRKKLLYIAIVTLIFTIGLFILSNVDVRGCDGLFGGLSGDCTSTNYTLWAIYSIPLTLLSFVGFLFKSTIPSMLGSLLFLIFNIFLLFISTVDRIIAIEIVSAIFSGMLFVIEINMINKTD